MMGAFKLARIRWSLGQTLLPEHLVLHEEALLAEGRLVAASRGLPAHGVARLGWNAQLLAQGELALTTLTLVLADGRLLDLPGNATLAPLDLRSAELSRVAVHLHLLPETGDARHSRLYEDDPRGVERVVHRLVLSTEPSREGVVDSLKLLELRRDAGGGWQLVSTWSPPLLLLGPSPYLRPLLESLATQVAAFRREVLVHLSDAYVARDRVASVRRMLAELQRFAALLSDLDQGVYPHPHPFFVALRSLYFEVCCFNEVEPDAKLPPYMHDEPAACFLRLAVLLKHQIGRVRPRMRYQAFMREGAAFLLSPIGAELRDAVEVYFLVQRPDLKARVSLQGVKLASPTRLPTVHRLALRGLGLEPLRQLEFPHSFGPDIDFYRVLLDEEWGQAIKERAVGFYARPELERVGFSLFWRS